MTTEQRRNPRREIALQACPRGGDPGQYIRKHGAGSLPIAGLMHRALEVDAKRAGIKIGPSARVDRPARQAQA